MGGKGWLLVTFILILSKQIIFAWKEAYGFIFFKHKIIFIYV